MSKCTAPVGRPARGRSRAARLAAVLAGVAVSVAGTAAVAVADPYGPDVSNWQHPSGASIDWPSVQSNPGSPNRFSIIEATQGVTWTNPYVQQDAAAARASGLTIGFYHFAMPNESAANQADHFAAVIGKVGPDELPPVLDIETSGGLAPPALQTWISQFLARIFQDTGRTPMVYTYGSFWNHDVASTAFGGYPLWLADYTGNPFSPVTPSTDPEWPMGWASFALWQYTDSATVAGITGGVDRSTACCGVSRFSVLADFDPNRLFIDALATDTTGALLPDPQASAADSALNSGQLTRPQEIANLATSYAYAAYEVRQAYLAVLKRAVDPSGLQTWTTVLESGASPAELYGYLTASAEFYQDAGSSTDSFIELVYQRLLARAADQQGLATWSAAINQGRSRQWLALALLGSAEGRGDQVQAAYQQVLGRSVDPSGLTTWSDVLGHNGDNITGLVEGLFASYEYFHDAQQRAL